MLTMLTIVWGYEDSYDGSKSIANKQYISVALFLFFLSLSHTLTIKLTYLGRQIHNNRNHIALAVSCGKKVGFSVHKRWMNTILQLNSNMFVNKEIKRRECILEFKKISNTC